MPSDSVRGDIEPVLSPPKGTLRGACWWGVPESCTASFRSPHRRSGVGTWNLFLLTAVEKQIPDRARFAGESGMTNVFLGKHTKECLINALFVLRQAQDERVTP